MVLGRSSLLRDPGTFWHVRLGQQMLDSGCVVRSDTLSFTRAGQPWVAQQWLAECGMAAVHRAGGLDGLLLATATLLAGLTTWIAWRLLRAGFHVLPVGVLLAVVLLASGAPVPCPAADPHVRDAGPGIRAADRRRGGPAAAAVALVAGAADGPLGQPARRRDGGPWHPGIDAGRLGGGLVLNDLGDCLVEKGTVPIGAEHPWAVPANGDSPLFPPVRRPRDLLAVVALLAACTGAVLLNPYGTDLPRAWLATLAIPLPELIQEHRPLDLGSPLGWTVVLLGLGYLVALAGCWPGRPSRKGATAGLPSSACEKSLGATAGQASSGTPNSPVRLLQRAAGWPRVTWLIPLVWFALAVARVRNVPLFAIVAVLAMAETIPRGRWAEWLRGHEMLVDGDHHEQATGRFGRSWPAAVLPALVVGAAVVLQVTGVDAPVVGRGWARLDPAYWPVALLPQLEKIDRTEPEATPIFNDLAFGGLLIYYTPHLRVFVDDRCACTGPSSSRSTTVPERATPPSSTAGSGNTVSATRWSSPACRSTVIWPIPRNGILWVERRWRPSTGANWGKPDRSATMGFRCGSICRVRKYL